MSLVSDPYVDNLMSRPTDLVLPANTGQTDPNSVWSSGLLSTLEQLANTTNAVAQAVGAAKGKDKADKQTAPPAPAPVNPTPTAPAIPTTWLYIGGGGLVLVVLLMLLKR